MAARKKTCKGGKQTPREANRHERAPAAPQKKKYVYNANAAARTNDGYKTLT